MTEGFTPMADRVAVRRYSPAKTTPSGILLPDSVQETLSEGEVIAVGPGHHENGVFVRTRAQVGDIVVFDQHMGVEYADLIILREGDLMGFLRKRPASVAA